MCIYYGEESSLTYNSQEHIFPATIGGVEKLPKGFVSDQANKYFSKLESEMVTSSLFGFEKMFYGPGYRGKDKPGRMPITLLTTENSEELGFVFMGKPILVPQMRISNDIRQVNIMRDKKYQTDSDLKKLFKQIQEFSNDSKYILLEVQPKNSKFFIAYYNGNLYIVSKDKEKIIEYINYIKREVLSKVDFSTAKVGDIAQPKVDISMSMDIDTNSRIFAKTAMNVISKVKGCNYLKEDLFDNAKKNILGLKDNDFKQMPRQYDITQFFNKINDKSHHCMFMNVDNNFCARVTFYNHWCMNFVLSQRFDSFFNRPYIYVCDWKNQKEYSIG